MKIVIDSGNSPGERELSVPSCRELVETAALIVALAIPSADEQPDEDPPPTPGVHDDEMPDAIALGVEKQPERPAPRVWRPRGLRLFGLPYDLSLRVMVGGDSGTLPEVAPSLHAVAAVQHDRWRVELGGFHVFEQRAPMAEDPATGGEISLSVIALRSCAEILRGRAVAALCAGAEVGRFRSTGYGNTSPRRESQLHLALLSGVSMSVRLQKYTYFRLDTSLARPLLRPRFAICQVGTVEDCAVPLAIFWQPQELIGRAVAGVEIFFQ